MPSTTTSKLRPRISDTYGPHGFEGRLLGYDLSALTRGELEALSRDVEALAAPPAKSDLHGPLLELRLKTASASMGHEDVKAQVSIYARDLTAYPAQAVQQALAEWPRQSRWWPTWYELQELIEPKAQDIRLLQREVQAALESDATDTATREGA